VHIVNRIPKINKLHIDAIPFVLLIIGKSDLNIRLNYNSDLTKRTGMVSRNLLFYLKQIDLTLL